MTITFEQAWAEIPDHLEASKDAARIFWNTFPGYDKERTFKFWWDYHLCFMGFHDTLEDFAKVHVKLYGYTGDYDYKSLARDLFDAQRGDYAYTETPVGTIVFRRPV